MVATPSANRHHVGLEDMLGNFVNMLPLRGHLTGNPGFGDFVRATRGTLLTAMENSDIPFPKLVEALDVPQTPSYTPIFQALVSLADEPLTGAGAEAESEPSLRLQALQVKVQMPCQSQNGLLTDQTVLLAKELKRSKDFALSYDF